MFMLQYRFNYKFWMAGLLLLGLGGLFFAFIFPLVSKTSSLPVQNVEVKESDPPTANSFASYVPYKGKYSYGVNPGYYGPNWSSQNIYALSAGDSSLQLKGVGAKSFRIPLYDDFLSTYGLTNLIPDLEYTRKLGASELTAFVGHPHATHQLDTVFSGAKEKSKVFRGMYQPIWLDAAKTKINPANTYAQYLYDVVKTYGKYVRFWEIVNEPDFTYSAAGWHGDKNPPLSGSWFERDPYPTELFNFQAPIQYYIRMLRISWDVVKKLSPSSYVCTGGIGYRSFLDALLRNTDNPSDGSVTPDYPLKAGAYFDVLSFHTYPMYYLKDWDNTSGTIKQFRHSDAAIQAHLNVQHRMDSLLRMAGYNGKKYPAKQFICTETGVSRIMGGEDWGSREGQKNYLLKTAILSQKAGIRQTYWFQLGDQGNPREQFDQMGLYYFFGQDKPFAAKPTDQGIALKTTSDLLYGKTYDPARTAALKLPSTMDGGAFKGPDGSYIYVLWARTTTDLSETAEASYSFPSELISTPNVTRMDWNFSATDTSSTLSRSHIPLTSTPAFFIPSGKQVNQNPLVQTGPSQVVLSPDHTATLSGSAKDPDGRVVRYQWTRISGPSQVTILSPGQASTGLKNLAQGHYVFRLTATDDKGATGISEVSLTVPVVLPARIEAESYTAMSGVQTENAWGDPQGGGLHVGWIDLGDWMEYIFAAPTEGVYKVNFRVASQMDGARFQVKKADGTVLATVDVPNTGGWQTWKTITTTMTLEKGLQDLKLVSIAKPIWNINWWEFSKTDH
ncbi:MAG: carbohydrate-binding protein [Flavisolibacter sp.]